MTLCPADLHLPPRFASYRKGQLTASLDIVASDKRWSLLQAGTGAGKTLIAATVARLRSGRTLQLTGTRALQSQAVNDFGEAGLKLIQGASNYRCIDSRRRTCEHGDDDTRARCQYRRRDSTQLCTQVAAQQVAKDADWVIANYATWLAVGRYTPDALGAFDTLWADEGHDALSWLTDACAMTFTATELRSISVDTPPSDGNWHDWSLVAIDAAVSAYRTARDRGTSPQQLTTLTELGKRLRELSASASGDSDVQWVGETVRSGWHWCPVWPAKFAEAKLWRGVPRVVLSSATLTHEDAKHLGLRRDDYSFHELDAGFSAARHPLYYLPVARIDKDMGEGEWRLVVNEWDRFIGARLKLGWRGVVQATSYEWAQRVMATSRHSEQMVTHDRRNAREVIAQFTRRDGPGVLVSPTVSEGHDFIDDICRWQVHVKLPFPNTLSPVLKARCTTDKNYRYHLAGRSFEQRCGRNMRKHTDWGENLVCDSHFGYMRGKPVFTRSFRATWRNVDAVPAPLELT